MVIRKLCRVSTRIDPGNLVTTLTSQKQPLSVIFHLSLLLLIIQIFRRTGSRGTLNNLTPSFVVFEHFKAEQDGICCLICCLMFNFV